MIEAVPMKSELFYCTGTGNSLWVARQLARELGDARVTPISLGTGLREPDAATIGIVFPVHIWGAPRRVLAFADTLRPRGSRYRFAVAVHAGQVAATLVRLARRMRKRGVPLAAGFGIVMPSNYIPWGGPGPEEDQQRRFREAEAKVRRIAAAVRAREERPVERGPLWQNLLFSGLNRIAFPRVPTMDRGFWADDRCDGCGVCERICPSDNITLPGGRPVWLHRCEQCLACIQWCPREAIQFGRKTAGYRRYHHPGVTLAEMLAQAKTVAERPAGQRGTEGR